MRLCLLKKWSTQPAHFVLVCLPAMKELTSSSQNHSGSKESAKNSWRNGQFFQRFLNNLPGNPQIHDVSELILLPDMVYPHLGQNLKHQKNSYVGARDISTAILPAN
jgi:hypothetical protein